MKKYTVTESIYGTRFVGTFEAKTKEEAIKKALDFDTGFLGLCGQCAPQIELEAFGAMEAEEV